MAININMIRDGAVIYILGLSIREKGLGLNHVID